MLECRIILGPWKQTKNRNTEFTFTRDNTETVFEAPGNESVIELTEG